MEKYSAWEDAIYTTTGMSQLTYGIYDEDNALLYTGRAYPRPNSGVIEVNVSQVVRNYLGSELPNTAFQFDSFVEGTHYLENAVRTFTMLDGMGNVLGTYRFLNCWNYKDMYRYLDNTTMNLNINQVVNNHTAVGQYTFMSTLLKTDKVRVTIDTVESATSCGLGCLYYSNSLGGYDSFLIEGSVKQKNEYERYNIDSSFRNNTLQFGHRNIVNTIKGSWELQTHYLTDGESKRLTDNLFGSNEVYFHYFEDNKVYPVTITDSSVEVKNWKNQGRKHYLHKINIENSQDRQRL